MNAHLRKPSYAVSKRRNCAGHLAEFPPALIVFFILIFFPLVNLLGLALGLASSAVIGFCSATRAAEQPTFDTALSAMSNEAVSFENTGVMRFLNLQPLGGYQNCGVDLFVNADNYRDGASKLFGPNVSVPPPVDTTTYVYEYRAHTSFQISPWIDMANVPFVNQVPGLGKPVHLSFDVSREVEAPGGLASAPGAGDGSSSGVGFSAPPQIANNSLPNLTPPLPGGGDWNYPNIYQLIAGQGQTVISTAVFTVLADNANLTMSGINVGPNENLWFDFCSDGEWSIDETYATDNCGWPLTDANGYPGTRPVQPPNLADASGVQFAPGLLVGKMSSSPYFGIGNDLTIQAPGTAPWESKCKTVLVHMQVIRAR